MRRQLAQLPLHTGSAPPWLFGRMWRLAGAVTMAVVDQYGPGEMLRRLADPWWFQAFGCVLGFDWHSSGVTTVTCGAMKEAYKHFAGDLGIHVAGGKGGTSRKTPQQIASISDERALGDGDQLLLNMVASEGESNRNCSVDLVGWNPDKLIDEARKLIEGPTLFAPAHHQVLSEDVNVDRLERIVRTVHEEQPADFTTLLG